MDKKEKKYGELYSTKPISVISKNRISVKPSILLEIKFKNLDLQIFYHHALLQVSKGIHWKYLKCLPFPMRCSILCFSSSTYIYGYIYTICTCIYLAIHIIYTFTCPHTRISLRFFHRGTLCFQQTQKWKQYY